MFESVKNSSEREKKAWKYMKVVLAGLSLSAAQLEAQTTTPDPVDENAVITTNQEDSLAQVENAKILENLSQMEGQAKALSKKQSTQGSKSPMPS